MLSELNRRITINTYTNTTDAAGGTSKAVSSTYTTWAKIDDRTGNASIDNNQRQANYDYKIKIRAYLTRAVTTIQSVTYDSKVLAINSVQKVSEGKFEFYILRCSVHGGT